MVANTENTEAERVTKLADQNVFSGRSDNLSRNFQILNDILQGIGHTSLTLFFNRKSREDILKRRQESTYSNLMAIALVDIGRDAINAFESTRKALQKDLNDLRDWSEELCKNGDITHKEHEQLIEQLEDIEHKMAEYERIASEKTQQIKDGRGLIEDSMQAISEIQIGGIGAPEFFKNLTSYTNKLVVTELDLTGEGVEGQYFVVSKDEQGYFISNPESGERIDINNHLGAKDIESIELMVQNGLSLGNESNPQDVIECMKAFSEWDKAQTGNSKLAKHAEALTSTYRSIKVAEAQIVEATKQLQKLKENITELREEMESKHGSMASYQETLDEYKAQKRALHQTLESAGENHAEALKKLNDLFDKIGDQEKIIAQEKREEAQANQLTEIIEERMKEFPDRHAQLEKMYGGGFEMWIKENTFFNGERSAKLYAGLNNIIGRDSKSVEAWNNSITHNGQDIYRDNDTGMLYTYNEHTGARALIKDPAIITQLYKQAYDDGQLFRNETPYSLDPKNTFEETLESTKLAAENINDHAQSNADAQRARTQEQEQILEDLKEEAETYKIEHNISENDLKPKLTSLPFDEALRASRPLENASEPAEATQATVTNEYSLNS